MAALTWKTGAGILCLVLFLCGLYTLLTRSEENRCEMTYMFENSQYIRIPLPRNVSQRFPQYHLFIYGEGRYAEELRTGRYEGSPILFIPGSGGCHKQVRSLASLALRMAQTLRSPQHFDFFSVDVNRHLSALYGGVLWDQTYFLRDCIQHILGLYASRGLNRTITIIGHSMGGVLSRALFLLPSFDSHSVSLVITLASPHSVPVLEMDSLISSFYRSLESVSLGNVQNLPMLVSIGGASRDLLVRSDLTSVPNSQGITVLTTSVPDVWLSTDHLCILWCKQLVKNIVRTLFQLINKEQYKITSNRDTQQKILHRNMIQGGPHYPAGSQAFVTFSQAGEWILKEEMTWRITKNKVLQAVYILVPLKKDENIVIFSKGVSHTNWAFCCQVLNKSDVCHQGESISSLAQDVPISSTEESLTSRFLHVSANDLAIKGCTHLLVYLMPSVKKINILGESYKRSVRHKIVILPSLLRSLTALSPLRMLTVPLSEGALFYNVSLRGLEQSWQFYSFQLETRVCRVGYSGGHGLVRFHIPWSHEDRFYFVRSSLNARTTIDGSLYQSSSNSSSLSQLHLILAPECSYSLTVSIPVSSLIAQFAKFYILFLPGYTVAILLATLSHQLYSIACAGLCPSVLSSLGNGQAFLSLVIVPEALHYILRNWRSELSILPSTDDMELEDRHLRFPLMRFFLFLVAYGCLTILVLTSSAVFTLIGATQIWVKKRLQKPILYGVEELTLDPMVVFISFSLALLGMFMCGAVSIAIACGVLAFKMVVLCSRNYYEEQRCGSSSTSSRWHLQHTLLHLHLSCFCLVLPSLLHWMQILTWHLPHDPHSVSAFILTLSWAILWQQGVPTKTRFHYKLISGFILVIAILASMYCLVNTWRVTHLLATAQALVAAQQMTARGKNKLN